MISREIIAALLRREIPERMGIYEHYWGETVPAWQKQGFPENAKVEDYFGYDIQGVGGWFDTGIRPGFQEEVIEETDEWRIRKDGRGATLKYWKAKSGTPEHIGFEINSPQAWQPFRESLLTLNPKRVDIPGIKKAMQDAGPTGRFRVYGNLFIFEIMRATLGDVCMLESLLLEPDWIKDFCSVYTQHFKLHYDYIFREAGLPDGMFIYEDVGFRNGLFCSPRTLAELVIPFYTELVGFFHDHGLPVILHSCGDVRQAVPLIIEAGFDCLQPMEAKAGNDVLEFAKLYGTRLSYMGNIDVTVLNRNDDRLTRAEVERKVSALAKMRIPYVFHSDHSVPPDINFATYKLAVDTFRKIGKY